MKHSTLRLRGTEKKGRYDLLALDAEFGTLLGEARAELLGPALVLPLLPVQLLRGVQFIYIYIYICNSLYIYIRIYIYIYKSLLHI